MKYLFIDFEFNDTSERRLNLVSFAAELRRGKEVLWKDSMWLHEDIDAQRLAKKKLEPILLADDCAMVCYTEAESRSLISLGIDPRKVKTVDLYTEYRLLLNHNHELSYGEQYLQGKIVKTSPPPPKWDKPDVDDGSHHKPSFSLAAACYKLLGSKIDTEEKNYCRDVIISSDKGRIESEKARILLYNESDIELLPKLMVAIFSQIRALRGGDLEPSAWLKEARLRGRYSAYTAVMIARGYPINMGKVKAFAGNVKAIMKDGAEACIEEAPEYEPFVWDRLLSRYKVNEKGLRKFIEDSKFKHWRKTEKGKLSLSKDAFGDFYSSSSPGLGGAFYRYLKTKQSLNGFLPPPKNSKKKSFFDFVGSDQRVRPFFGTFGSQSSRSQPSATGFIPLKSHWMRNFIEPPEGMAIAGIDYASQEFLISAILSQDTDMIRAYSSGDVYLAFGKAAGIIPKEGTKATHKKERDACKATVLGISYDMTSLGLAPRLSASLNRTVSSDEAQGYIDAFYGTYPDFQQWKYSVQREYAERGFLDLADGWTMWGDNDNRRSVGNFPVQGTGAVIMRQAVHLAEKSGCRVIFTLHDAIYIEYPAFQFDAIKLLMGAMQAGFQKVMARYGRTIPIRLEGETWSKEYSPGISTAIKDVVAMPEYIDDKGRLDHQRFQKYFT